VEVQKSCAALGKRCALEPPPGYWTGGPGGGAYCDDACMEEHGREVASRALPACMCTCDPEYQKQDAAWRERMEREGPKP
jgi:hypothetical protein